MSPLRLIWQEARYRRGSFLMSVLGVAAAVMLVVVFLATSGAARRTTRRQMARMGYNLLIVPGGTEMAAFWERGFSARTMPQSHVARLVDSPGLNHLIPRLHASVDLGGARFLITGQGAEVCPPGRRKPPLVFSVEPGTLHVGFEVARRLGLAEGDELEVLGRRFRVAACLVEQGSDDDRRLVGELGDIQALLGLEGRINEIDALDCLCLEPEKDPLGALRAQVAALLPDVRVLQRRALAEARARQRRTEERYHAFLLPVSLLLCAAWVGVLAMLNVRERRQEIGLLRALGHGSRMIGTLFLGRAVLVGVLGAALGWGLGSAVAVLFGPAIFKVPGGLVKPQLLVLGAALLAAPLLAAMASAVPAAAAVTADPARTLRGE